LPGHAPELNPDEGAWWHLKLAQLANVYSPHLDTRRRELNNKIGMVQVVRGQGYTLTGEHCDHVRRNQLRGTNTIAFVPQISGLRPHSVRAS
jgi:hypothetical protein